MGDITQINVLAIIGLPGWTEVLVIAFVGLLLFGKRLPDVARSLGKSVVEFKKGIRDVKDEVNSASSGTDRPEIEAKPQPKLDPANSEAERTS
jgi:sec-independent protein translocase protein TatA